MVSFLSRWDAAGTEAFVAMPTKCLSTEGGSFPGMNLVLLRLTQISAMVASSTLMIYGTAAMRRYRSVSTMRSKEVLVLSR